MGDDSQDKKEGVHKLRQTLDRRQAVRRRGFDSLPRFFLAGSLLAGVTAVLRESPSRTYHMPRNFGVKRYLIGSNQHSISTLHSIQPVLGCVYCPSPLL